MLIDAPLHYAVQADHWEIVWRTGPATYCVVLLKDADGKILWSNNTPFYRKGDDAKREHKARTFAGTIIANFQSGHRFEVPILENGKTTTCWPNKPGRELKYKA